MALWRKVMDGKYLVHENMWLSANMSLAQLVKASNTILKVDGLISHPEIVELKKNEKTWLVFANLIS